MSTDLQAGSTLLGYRLERLIGRGGMGVVYLAHDARLKRQVAVKLLTPELAVDDRFRRRFLAETELAASLEHPNVIPIHDAGEIDGQLYLVMRYVEGGDLREVLAGGAPLDADRALLLCDQIASALDAAHERGLVHRDVKPSNVLIDRDEHVYICDFGLAETVSRRTSNDGHAELGTLDYVAPEQIAGAQAGARSDVYAFACLVYHCLTGEPPFRRDSAAETLFAQLHDPPPVATALRPDLPAAVDEALCRGMSKSPAERTESAGVLTRELRAALGGPERATRRSSRQLVLAAALVAIALVGAIVFVVRDGAPPTRTFAGDASVVRLEPRPPYDRSRISIGAAPSSIAVGADAVWVASLGTGTLQRLDPVNGQMTHSVGVAAEWFGPTGLATTPARSLVDSRGEWRGEVLWVADTAQGDLIPFDTKLERLSDSESAYPTRACVDAPAPEDLALVGGDAIWLTDYQGVRRVNLQGGGVANVDLGRTAHQIAAGGGKVWAVVFGATSSIVRIDPARMVTERRRAIPIVGAAIAFADGSVWVAASDRDEVWRFDPVSLDVMARVRVGAAPRSLAFGDGAMWVTNELDGTLSRVDVRTNRVTDTVEVGPAPRFVAYGHEAVWVATSPVDGATGADSSC